MIASVHIADVGPAAALRILARPPRPASVPGLRHANVAVAAPLSSSVTAKPQPGRIALLGFWDDDEAVDRFEADHPLAQRLAGGWHSRLEPLRMHGSWPGVPTDLPTGRSVDHDGPAVVLTLGRLRISQAPRFLRTSAKAEGAAVQAPGFRWGTGLARPPFVATCSLWESSAALSTYAYGRRDPSHPGRRREGLPQAVRLHPVPALRVRRRTRWPQPDGTGLTGIAPPGRHSSSGASANAGQISRNAS